MIAALALLCAGLAAVLTGLALAPVVDDLINRRRLRRRVATLPQRSAVARPRTAGEAAAPLLRTGVRSSDALVMRWLPGGAAVAAQLAAAGGGVGATALVAAAAGAAVAAAVLAAALGLPTVLAALLVPALVICGAAWRARRWRRGRGLGSAPVLPTRWR